MLKILKNFGPMVPNKMGNTSLLLREDFKDELRSQVNRFIFTNCNSTMHLLRKSVMGSGNDNLKYGEN